MFRANRIRDLPFSWYPIIALALTIIILLATASWATTEFDVGISTSSGVVDQQQAIVDIAYSEGNKKISGQWRYTETEGQRIEEKGLVRAEWNKTLNEKWVIWNYEQAGYDCAREIQVENFIGSGPKYTFLDSKETILTLSVGMLHHWVDYDDGSQESLCRYSIRPKFRGDWDRWRLEAWAFYQPTVNNFDNYILHGRVSLRYAITDEVGLKGSIEDEYRSVSVGEKNNLMTSLAVSWVF